MRILLADNQVKVRFALRALLEQQPGLTVVGEAAEAKEVLAQVEAVQPDLVLLDWNLCGLATADLLPALRRICPDLRVVALSARPEMHSAALEAGANAFASKTDPPECLVKAIQKVKSVTHDDKEKIR
jgi:DNA-binding NarL/FixJ family response regulator